MNKKTAKLIRKLVYEDLSLKSTDVRKQGSAGRMIMNTGWREVYQEAKRHYMNLPWRKRNLKSPLKTSWLIFMKNKFSSMQG